MIDFIKNLFSGILSFFIGLFGGKKSQENKPSIAASKPEANTASKPAVAQQSKGKSLPSTSTAKPRKRSGYFMELDESEEMKPVNGNQQAKAAATKTPEPVAAAKPAKAEPAKPMDQAAASKAAAKIELVQTAEGIKAEPAKRESSSPAASTNGQSQTETTFAPKYLAPASSSNRRRPGPNMNSFLDMARQVKTQG